jgi:hypothetical protein
MGGRVTRNGTITMGMVIGWSKVSEPSLYLRRQYSFPSGSYITMTAAFG